MVLVPEPVLVLEVVVVVVLVGSGSGVRANHAKNKGTEHRASLAKLHPTMQPSCVADHQVHLPPPALFLVRADGGSKGASLGVRNVRPHH